MSEKPEVGFQFGVEGDQSLLATVRALREELKNLHQQQQTTASSAELLHRAWSGLVQLGALVVIAKFGRDVFDTAVALGKLSQITGISTETLSVYYKAATDVGVAHEAVDKGLGRLSRSFVMLQAGNAAAVVGFHLLHLSAKDFVGLNPDEKVRKVSDAFAAMKDGPEKAAAAIALLGKAGQTLIPVFNQLGGAEFAKLAEQAQRLGLIFTTEMAQGALRAKAALADLTGVAEGATAQFETGLVPALADAADGIVAFALETDHANKNGENSFKSLGAAVGWAVKAIILVLTAAGTTLKDFFLTVGVGVETLGREIINVFATIGGVIIETAQLKFGSAWQILKDGGKESAQAFKDAWAASAQSVKDSNARFMAEFDQMFPAEPKKRKLKEQGPPGDATGAELEKGLGRAEASGLKQRSQDELALYKALTQKELEEDKRAYEQGLTSLTDYFNRRRGAVQQGFVEELKALGAEKAGLQDLLAKAEGESTKTPKQDLAKQAQILQVKQQIAHVDAQEAIELTKRDTELEKNETERAKAKQDHLLKELEEQKKLADLEGDRAKSAQLAIQIEDLQMRHELEQLGKTKAEIDAFMSRYGAARGIRTAGAAAQQGFEGGEADLANKKAALQEQVANYQLQPYQAERQLRDEYAKEIPFLETKVQLLRQQAAAAQAAADARGEKGPNGEQIPNAEAVDLTKQADQDETKLIRMRTEMTKMDTTWLSWRTAALQSIDQVSTHLTTGLNGWMQGQQRFGAAMKQMWNGIVMTGVNALEKLAAQWIAHHLRMLLVKVTTNQMGVASDASAAAQKTAIDATTARKSIFKSAASAAAKAWDAMANIPYVGPILGAIAAAVTFAGVMALGAFAQGGYVGRGGGAPRTLFFAGGGQMIAQSMLGGGFLRGPGSSTSDSIPAMLSDREYVVNAKAVRSVGVETLDMINRGALNGAFLPPLRHSAPYTANGFRMASGGLAKSLGSSGAGNSAPTIHNHNTISSSSIDSKDFRDHIDDHMDYIADELKGRMRNFRF